MKRYKCAEDSPRSWLGKSFPKNMASFKMLPSNGTCLMKMQEILFRLGEFKRKLLVQIRPPCRSVYNLHNAEGARSLARLRVVFSSLYEHRLRHHFDCLRPLCICGIRNEDNEHFLLHCPVFDNAGRDILDQLGDIPLLEL